MPLSTTLLLNSLASKLHQFRELCSHREEFPEVLAFSVSLSYSRLQFSAHSADQLFLQFSVWQGEVSPAKLYFHDRVQIENLKRHFSVLTYGIEENDLVRPIFSNEVYNYLRIAESIASTVYNCTAGDDYRPGYFSEIYLEGDSIFLRQNNHLNSKSLDHKNNYSLRNLQFIISLDDSGPLENGLAFEAAFIGKMKIDFSDNSSAQNKQCGARIWKRIEEEKAEFNKK